MGFRILSYYSDQTLLQEFLPMAAQLSMKAVLPLAKILATASCRSSKDRALIPLLWWSSSSWSPSPSTSLSSWWRSSKWSSSSWSPSPSRSVLSLGGGGWAGGPTGSCTRRSRSSHWSAGAGRGQLSIWVLEASERNEIKLLSNLWY